MKVEQGQPEGFAPITITIETKEEADVMWALFNAPTQDVVKNSGGHLVFDKISTIIYNMFCAFDDVLHKNW